MAAAGSGSGFLAQCRVRVLDCRSASPGALELEAVPLARRTRRQLDARQKVACRLRGWGAEGLLGASLEVRWRVARLVQLDEWVWGRAPSALGLVAQPRRVSPLAVRWPEHAPALSLPVVMEWLAEA